MQSMHACGFEGVIFNPVASYGGKAFYEGCVRNRRSPVDGPLPNVVCAPLAEFCLLGMMCAGTEDSSTAKLELRKALFVDSFGANDTESKMQAYFHGLCHTIQESGSMHMHASLWADGVLPEFNEKLKMFGAVPMKPRDYTEINLVVSQHTDGMIPHLLSRNHDAFLFLSVNFYKGIWKHQMDPKDSYESLFVGYKGAEVRRVPYMRFKGKVASVQMRHSRSFVLEYADNFAAIFLQPNDASEEGMRRSVEEICRFDSVQLLVERTKTRLTDICLTIPKFTLNYSGDLEQSCRALGVSSMFEDKVMTMALDPDYDGPVTSMPIKVCMKMDEEGTTFAAAAAAGGTRGGGPPSFILNSPFVLCIFHMPSKTPLLLAQIHKVD